jgi:hypothetical protein
MTKPRLLGTKGDSVGHRWELVAIANLIRQGQSVKNILEQPFSVAVVDYAKQHGWLVHYERQSGFKGTDGKWKGSGPKGKPDLTLARDGVILLAELKKEGGTLSEDQRQWLAALGPYGRLWKPRDAERIMEELA